MTSVGFEESTESSGTRLRRLAQELLPSKERSRFREALKQFRDKNMLKPFLSDLGQIVTSYDRLPLINAIAEMFPESPAGKDKLCRKEFLDNVAAAIPLFESTRRLSTAARRASIGSKEEKEKVSPRRNRAMSRERFSRREASSNAEKGSPAPGVERNQHGRRYRKRSTSRYGDSRQPINGEADCEDLAINQRMQEERRKERPTLAHLVDKGFWSPDDSLSSESDSGRKGNSRRMLCPVENWRATSHSTLFIQERSPSRQYHPQDYYGFDDRRRKNSFINVSTSFDSSRSGDSSLKEQYINIPFEKVSPLPPETVTIMKPYCFRQPNYFHYLTETAGKPRCFLRSLGSKRDLCVINPQSEPIHFQETLKTTAIQVSPITMSIGVQTDRIL